MSQICYRQRRFGAKRSAIIDKAIFFSATEYERGCLRMAIKRYSKLSKQGQGGQTHESERPPLAAEVASYMALEQKKKPKCEKKKSRMR